jgi:hypothetical protein
MRRSVRLGLGWVICLAVSPSGFATGQHADAPASASTAPALDLSAVTHGSAAPANPVDPMLLQQLALRPVPAASSSLATQLLESTGSGSVKLTLPDQPSQHSGQGMSADALTQQLLLQHTLRHSLPAENTTPIDDALMHLQTPAPPSHMVSLQALLKRHLAPDCVKPDDHRSTPLVATGAGGTVELTAYKTWTLMNQPDARKTVQTQLQKWGATDAYIERGATQFDAFREAPFARNAVVGVAGFAAFYNIAAWMDPESPANACADQEGWAFLRHGQAFRLWMGVLGLVLAIALYSLLKKAGVLR